MNEPNESEFEISVPEGATIEEAVPETPTQDAPVPEVPGSVTHVLPEGYITAKAPEPQPESPAEEPPPEEPEIVRHDPFAYMRGAPWMNRKLSPSGRAAAFARRELKAFPAIEGREPNGADIDAIVKRTVDYMVPIFRREQATDIAYDELERRRAARIAAKRRTVPDAPTGADPNIIKVSGGDVVQGEPGPALAQLGPEARRERIRAEKWSSPTDDADYLKSLEKYDGRKVRLPDGSLVPDRHSPTHSLMSPVDDLRPVARAGRTAGRAMIEKGIAIAIFTPQNVEQHYGLLYEFFRLAIAQGGEFDYQRKAAVGAKDGFVQLRQFRNVSNFNVGLFMQQAGFPLEVTLGIAGFYAWKNSSNFRPDLPPYFLDPQTREFIERGYEAGESGAFN